ncbi:MAG: lamin tail domain-containing protein [Planctomycetota bacterium]
MNSLSTRALSLATVLLGSLIFVPSSLGQVPPFEVTEIMYNPRSAEDDWEWIEIRNTSGAELNLDGYFLSAVDDNAATAASISLANGSTTVPVGGLAVLYNGGDLGFDGVRFKAAWPLIPASVPVIGVDNWLGLRNSPPEEVGFWADEASYLLDQLDESELMDGTDINIVQTANAAVSVTYDDSLAEDWPVDDGFASIQWKGVAANPALGSSWTLSSAGTDDATTSVETILPGDTFKNSASDTGSPGVVPSDPAPNLPAAIVITEVMYDPNSPDPEWEWVEILNNTGAQLNLAGYVFDDLAGNALSGPNIAAGTVEDGDVAVLFNDDVSLQDMIDAWGAGINFIPVSDWSGLNSSGDTFGLWADHDDSDDAPGDPIDGYLQEPTPGTGRTFDNAVASLTYTDDPPFGDSDNSGSSIYLTDLDGTNANGATAEGSIWPLASTGDGISFAATLVPDGTPAIDNTGMDVGSPGFFTDVASTLVGDYNGNGMIDAGDYTVWRDAFGDGTNPAPLAFGDGTPGSTTVGDYTAWRDAFLANNGLASLATTTPEPTAAVLVALGLLLAPAARRR